MSQTAKQTPPADGTDRPSPLPPADQTATPPPGGSPHPGPARPAPPRRGLLRWILIPLAAVGVGFVGYRLGQTGTTSAQSSGFSGGFGAGQSAGAGQSGERRSSGQGTGQGGGTTDPGTGSSGAGSTASGTPGRTTSGTAGSQGERARGQQGRTEAGRTEAGRTERGTAAAGGAAVGSAAAGSAAGATTGAATGATDTGRGSGRAGGSATGRFAGIVTPVQAQEVKAGTLTTERRLTGTVSTTQSVSVNPQTSGTVTTVLKNVGDRVASGQTVLTLTNTDLNTSVQSAQNTLDSAQAALQSQRAQISGGTASLQQAITSAQAALTNAERTYAAQQQLYAIGALARSALQEQEVQVQSARNSLVAAQTNLANAERTNAAGLTTAQLNVQKAQIALDQARSAAGAARVQAPLDGQITAMNVTAGQYLGSGTAAFTVVGSVLQVKVNVPTTEATTLPVGAPLTLVVGQQKYPLKVSQNAGAVTGGSVPVTARFLPDASGTLQQPPAGTVGSVAYTARVATGVLVPSTALQTDGDATYVFTIANGRAKQNTVTVLGQAGTQSAISGVEAGAQVISQPPTGLLDGSAVTTANARTRSEPQGAGGPPGGAP